MNREEEKGSCQGELGQSSCDHYSSRSQVLIRFFWNMRLGNNTCTDIRRDFCYGNDDDDTEHCLRLLMPSSAKESVFGRALVNNRDVLLLNTVPVNTDLFCKQNKNGGGTFADIFGGYLMGYDSVTNGTTGSTTGQEKVCTVDYAAWAARMLLRVFPGRIVYLSYPYLNIADEAESLQLNKEVALVNNITRAGIESAVSSDSDSSYAYSNSSGDRIQFLDLTSLLAQHISLYADPIHHHGKLSELVIRRIFAKLADMPVPPAVMPPAA